MTSDSPKTVVLAFDKFRGTAEAGELVHRSANAAASAGWQAIAVPLGDGGEGSLGVLGGPNKTTTVAGPLGQPVQARWRLDGDEAFIEMAAASGLAVAGGSEGNDPLQADTTGTGQLISAAIELGARRVVVLLGGSATTDGGLGAVEALPVARLSEIELEVAADVETSFVDAAAVFGPQKGASPAQVKLLTRRLERLVELYQERYGVDVSTVRGAGAAGGLAGGLLAVGGEIGSGFDILADHVRLDEKLAAADLVITGEGQLDAGSFDGKVVGGVQRWAAETGVPVAAIVGRVAEGFDPPAGLEVRSLAARYGLDRANEETLALVESEVVELLRR